MHDLGILTLKNSAEKHKILDWTMCESMSVFMVYCLCSY